MKLRIIISVLTMCGISFAFSPSGHIWIDDQYFVQYPGDYVSTLCKDYHREFRAGSIMPDITVFYYFTNGGQNYLLTHNWEFQQRIMRQAVTQAEQCYAYGIALHEISDATVHNGFIAQQIREKALPNIPLHPLLEAMDEAYLQKYNRITADEMAASLTIMAENPRLLEITKKALGSNIPFDVEDQTRKLSDILGKDFYATAYNNPNPSVFYSVWKAVGSVIAQPDSAEEKGMQAARQSAVDNTHAVFTNPNILKADQQRVSAGLPCIDKFCIAEPDGFTALNYSEDQATMVRLFIGVVVVTGALLIVRGRKR